MSDRKQETKSTNETKSKKSTKQRSEAQKVLLALLANRLFGAQKEIPEDTDYLAVAKEAQFQAVTAAAFNGTPLPQAVKEKINDEVISYIASGASVFSAHSELDGLLRKNGVPYVILKGAASAYYYPDPLNRAMGDVDFLVKKDDIPRATEILKNAGFTPWKEAHICHIVFTKENEHLEMHFEPAGIPNGKQGEMIRGYLSDAIDRANYVQTELCSFYNPSKFHHGLIMLLHMQHHLLSEGIGLRHLCDWAVFVNSMTNEEFTATFQEKLRRAGLYKFAQTISLAAHIGMDLPYRDFMGDDKCLAEDILNDILSGGNFGAKDSGRACEGLFISNRGKDGVSKNRFTQFFASVNQIVYTHWPVSKKAKILLPFGWLYFGGRYLVRTLTGKRKRKKFLKAYSASKERKELYKKLHLFEEVEDERSA